MEKWIWKNEKWPQFHWSGAAINPLLREVRNKLGLLLGMTSASAFDGSLDSQALDTLLANIVASSAIENERLNAESVRSSLAKRFGISSERTYPVSESSEGLAEMLFDALSRDGIERPLTKERLFRWHECLFPGCDDLIIGSRVSPGKLRGPEVMQVVSGRIDRPVVHFEAPPRDGLEKQLDEFLVWFEESRSEQEQDPLLRAGIAHLWFVTLHPFDDGNGRLTRMLTDLALAQADHHVVRLYAMSVSILDKREEYYSALKKAQRGTTDITSWLEWFYTTLLHTLDDAQKKVSITISKAEFWLKNRSLSLRPEQLKVLNRMLDGGEKGFEGGISASQYQSVAKVSKATATRHLAELLENGCLVKGAGGGGSSRYFINTSKK